MIGLFSGTDADRNRGLNTGSVLARAGTFGYARLYSEAARQPGHFRSYGSVDHRISWAAVRRWEGRRYRWAFRVRMGLREPGARPRGGQRSTCGIRKTDARTLGVELDALASPSDCTHQLKAGGPVFFLTAPRKR